MFRTPLALDRTNRIMTMFFIALILVIAGAMTFVGSDSTRYGSLLVLGVLVLVTMMSPRALVVENGVMRIERRMWPALVVPLAEVESASPLDSLGKRVVKVSGAGGVFGSYGLFWSDTLRWFRLYATRRGQAIIVRRTGSLLPIVMTPDDVAGAIAAIDRRSA